MVKMVLLPLTFLMHLYSPQQGRLPRYSTSSCGSNIRKANYISMICHYCASGVNGSILYDAKHASAMLLPTKSWNAKLFKVKNPFQR